MTHPLADKITRDDVLGILTVDGIQISYEVLEHLTRSTPERTWLRLERSGESMIVHQRTDPGKRVPLLRNFDPREVLGFVQYDDARLPDNELFTSCLTVGGIFSRSDQFEVKEFGVVPDESYRKYLNEASGSTHQTDGRRDGKPIR